MTVVQLSRRRVIAEADLHNFTKRQYPCNTPIVTLV
jgi:hypothetical protein